MQKCPELRIASENNVSASSSIATIRATLRGGFITNKMQISCATMPGARAEFYIIDEVNRRQWRVFSVCNIADDFLSSSTCCLILFIEKCADARKNIIYVTNSVYRFKSSLFFVIRQHVNGFIKELI